jgi:hypothetical protein
MTPAAFRRLALSFEDSAESAHMRHPDFRVAGRIFATLGYPDKGWGALMLTPAQQKKCVDAAPDVFRPAAGAWGRKGSTCVYLRAATKPVLLPALESAWWNAALKRPHARPPRRARIAPRKTSR